MKLRQRFLRSDLPAWQMGQRLKQTYRWSFGKSIPPSNPEKWCPLTSVFSCVLIQLQKHNSNVQNTHIGVCWILCAWSLIKNLTGWCRKVFHCSLLCIVFFYFQIRFLLFPSSGSCWPASRIVSIMQSSSPSLYEEIKWNSGTKKDVVLKTY